MKLRSLGAFIIFLAANCFADIFRVATYNVENYLDTPTETRHFVKSAEAKAKICESIEAIDPDVLALQEIGSTNALMGLRASLKADGQNFPFWDYIESTDTNIHIAVLSKCAIVSRCPHTNEQFILDGRRFRVSRGFIEDEIAVTTNFHFTLIVAHLKSRRPVPSADEAEERIGEAKVLRGISDMRFQKNPNEKLIIAGDFNDLKSSDSVKLIIGRGKFKLTDTRPAESSGDNTASSILRSVTWTHYYGIDDTYSRIDYLLLSPAMARCWMEKGTYVLALSNWGIGSDHRPIVAAFEAK